MKKIIVLLILFFWYPLKIYAVNYCNDANCMGAWVMENDGNEPDVSGESETLTETGGDIPLDADEKFGTYSRDWEAGDTEYLVHADGGSTDISGADQELTIVCFYKPESIDYYGIVTKYDYGTGDSNDLQYRLRLESDGSVTMNIKGTYIQSNTNLSADTWYHIAGVYDDDWLEADSTSIEVFIDGSADGTSNTAYVDGVPDGDAPFSIGTYFNNTVPARYLDGLIDDVGMFDRELSSVEISDIASNGLGYEYEAPPEPSGEAYPQILFFD